jgi:hypothetical protein
LTELRQPLHILFILGDATTQASHGGGPVFAIFGKMQVKGFFKTLRRETETEGGGGGF